MSEQQGPPRGIQPGVPVIWAGNFYPSRSALARHIERRYGIRRDRVLWALRRHGVAGLEPLLKDLALVEISLTAEPPRTQPPPKPNGGDALTEIGENLGLIRGAFDARRNEIAVLREQLDLAKVEVEPALRRLRELNEQFDQVTQAISRLERQANEDRERALANIEIVNLINQKITTLAHDILQELPPRPTRRNPQG